MKVKLGIAIGVALVASPALSKEIAGIGRDSASATIIDPSGVPVGKAKISHSKKRGLIVEVSVRNQKPGDRAVHIHTFGRCEGPSFASAGGHWNPTNRQHGANNPAGTHHGDLPNILINRKGNGKLKADIAKGEFRGQGGLLDEDGATVVLHALSDDQRTDPSGNSGERIACGVLQKD